MRSNYSMNEPKAIEKSGKKQKKVTTICYSLNEKEVVNGIFCMSIAFDDEKITI